MYTVVPKCRGTRNVRVDAARGQSRPGGKPCRECCKHLPVIIKLRGVELNQAPDALHPHRPMLERDDRKRTLLDLLDVGSDCNLLLDPRGGACQHRAIRPLDITTRMHDCDEAVAVMEFRED